MGFLYELADDFLSLLFPRICHGCDDHLLRNEKLICTECLVSIPRTDYHLTDDNPVARLFWGRCPVERAAAFSFYTRGTRIRKIIHALKYEGVKDLGELLGRLYGKQLNESRFLDGIDLIIPVPLHPAREQKRGFNQSAEICAGLSAVTGIQASATLLKRSGFSATQTKRSRYDRWLNVEGIFTLTDVHLIQNKHVLLVDDVITTGSTIEACVSELMKAGNIRISVAAIAWSPA